MNEENSFSLNGRRTFKFQSESFVQLNYSHHHHSWKTTLGLWFQRHSVALLLVFLRNNKQTGDIFMHRKDHVHSLLNARRRRNMDGWKNYYHFALS